MIPSIDVVNQSATISTVIAGSAGLIKTGLGALMLGGATEIFTNGLTSTPEHSPWIITTTNSPATNIVSANNVLTLGGGALQIIGGTNAPSSQTFASTTLNAGGSAIFAAPVSGTNIPTLTLAAMTENLGGTVCFSGPTTISNSGNLSATATITTTTAGAGALGTIGTFGPGTTGNGTRGAYATVGLYDFASTDTVGGSAGTSPYTIIGGSQVTGFYQTTGITTTTGAYDVTANVSDTANSRVKRAYDSFQHAECFNRYFQLYQLQWDSRRSVTPKCGAVNETLAANGLQFVRTTTIANDYGVIWQDNTAGYLNVNTSLQPGRLLNGGGGNSCGLVQDGIGTVVYAGVNDYDLATYLNGGYSVVSADSGFGRPSLGGMINLNGGTVVGNATFNMDNAGTECPPILFGRCRRRPGRDDGQHHDY